MIRRTLVVSRAAKRDLDAIFAWVNKNSGSADTALAFVERLEQSLEKLEVVSQRGTPWDDIEVGLRSIPFERSATIVFRFDAKHVTIARIFYAGQNWQARWKPARRD